MAESFDILFQNDDLVAVGKPAGLATHSPDGERPGLAEMLGKQLGCRLGVHQRLDAATSGVIVFSKSAAGAKKLARAFENRRLSKVYYAVVCGCPPEKTGTWQHSLVHENGITLERAGGKQSVSRYAVERSFGPFSLLRLELLTGMTHQLRVQCALAGCPILGDSLYGGGDCAPRLFLHAHSLKLPEDAGVPEIVSSLPGLFERGFAPLVEAILANSPLPEKMAQDEACRVLVPQHSGIPELIVEKIASVLHVRHLEPSAESVWNVESLNTFFELAKKQFDCSSVSYHVHQSPQSCGSCAAFAKQFAEVPDPLVASENGNLYTFEFSGNATGLYLDQRENRAWVTQNAWGRVLNLFAYTCAFSVCAARSARVCETTSVDAAPAALNRGRANFELNHIDTAAHRFVHQDVFKYLERCDRNGVRFDTIICDPPSFGRFGKIVFSLEKDLGRLLDACFRLVTKHGVVLFCINHRKISIASLRAQLHQVLDKYRLHPQVCEVFVNDSATGPLGVGTDLKTIRVVL